MWECKEKVQKKQQEEENNQVFILINFDQAQEPMQCGYFGIIDDDFAYLCIET